MTTATTSRSDRRISPVFLGILAVTAVTGWATWTGFAEQPGLESKLSACPEFDVTLCGFEPSSVHLTTLPTVIVIVRGW